MVVFSDNEEELQIENTRKYEKSISIFVKFKRFFAFSGDNKNGFSQAKIEALKSHEKEVATKTKVKAAVK